MRLPPLSPNAMNPEQVALYDDMKAGVAAKYSVFQTMRDDGAFIGPWNAWLHDPEIGSAMWSLSKAMTKASRLPDDARQIAILVVGAHYRAGYEIYAHEAVAARRHGMSAEKLALLRAGKKPSDMTKEESLAYDVARALTGGGVLPAQTYNDALAELGQSSLNELVYLVGYYSMLSMTLNAFDVPVP